MGMGSGSPPGGKASGAYPAPGPGAGASYQ
jgi:hypothetical protein